MTMAKQIASVKMNVVDKKGMLASFWVVLTNGIGMKVMLVEGKTSGQPFISLPSQKYQNANGEINYMKLITVPQDLYEELTKTLIENYNNAKTNGVHAPAPEPAQEPATPGPAAIPSMEDIINQA